MKTIALVSGGKDSILAMLMAYRYGHESVVIVNIVPATPKDASATTNEDADTAHGHDIDSYMYQTVGFEAVETIAACLSLPLRRACVKRGQAKDQSLLYSEQPQKEDEVESLYTLLKEVKEEFPEVGGLTSGAILSNYQRNRVEFLCDRLGLESLAYLWMRQPEEILDMAHALSVRAILVKTASIGLVPRALLGKTLEEVRPTLEKMEALYQSHLAGEGGEYETTVLSCPLFAEEQLEVTSMSMVMEDENDIAPSGHALLTVARLPKSTEQQAVEVELLRRLKGGEITFPSDVLPLLRRLSTAGPPPPTAVTAGAVSDESTPTPLTTSVFMTAGVVREGVETHVTAACGEKAATSVQLCLAEAQKWATDNELSIFFYHITVPSLEVLAGAQSAYKSSVSHVCPPSLLLTCAVSSEDSTDATVTVEILAAPTSTIGQHVLHAQSRSCWGLGEPGPYAQARRVGLANGEKRVFVSPTPGRVPTTRRLATLADLPAVCQGHVEPFVADAESAAVVAQFLFAMANTQSYLALYRRDWASVSRATIVVTPSVPLALLPELWRWCVSTPSFTCVCTVVAVGGLPDGECLRVSVECEEPCEE